MIMPRLAIAHGCISCIISGFMLWVARPALANSQQEVFTPGETTVSQVSQTLCPAQLGTAIEAVLRQPQWHRARWGLLIQALTTDLPLYAREAEQYFLPASNAKLLTTAAALHRLGSDYRIRTSIFRVNPEHIVLKLPNQLPSANPTILQLVGRGDPSLTTASLQDLAQQLSRQGVRQIDLLLVDNQYFRGEAMNATWAWEDLQSGDAVPINSLILNQNATELQLIPQRSGQPLKLQWNEPGNATGWRVRNDSLTVKPEIEEFVDIKANPVSSVLQIEAHLQVGSLPEVVGIPISNPTQHFIQQFRQALNRQQIAIARTELTDQPMTTAETEVAFVESPPLSTLLAEVNQNSNNLYAEALLRVLGTLQPLKADETTADSGLDIIKTTLKSLGVDPNSYHLVDASGLSRQNLVSPQALVQTLASMARRSTATPFQAALASAGKTGTLKNRFRATPSVAQVLAKSGTLNGIGALSGYVFNPNFQPLIFSILVNQSDQPPAAIRRAIDEIVLLLMRLHRC
jgi:D-alanyl-D-alanine carboxypeptidase/D-alanyl-D-alanine-endopeptidase (penicillin-binding protein 4)